jgi:putative transposase
VRWNVEPGDHAVGRSRGGLSTKVHLLVDDTGRPLVVVVSPGQAGDNPALQPMLNQLRVARRGPGRPRTRPFLVRADKAYSARATRAYLRRRGIKVVIPEPADQAGHRKRKGSRGGRPVSYDPVEYAGRNVIERGFNVLKQWRALATRYDCEDVATAPGLRPDPRYDRPTCLAFDLSAVGPGWDVLPPVPAGVSR